MATIRELKTQIEQKRRAIKLNKKMLELIDKRKTKADLNRRILQLQQDLFLLEVQIKTEKEN